MNPESALDFALWFFWVASSKQQPLSGDPLDI
jgi:hypothetical protein